MVVVKWFILMNRHKMDCSNGIVLMLRFLGVVVCVTHV